MVIAAYLHGSGARPLSTSEERLPSQPGCCGIPSAAGSRGAYRPGNGSPIISEVDAMPGLAFIKAGTLDDTKWLKPTMELFCSSAQPWVPAFADAQRFEKGPG
jgi:hypothetical protein